MYTNKFTSHKYNLQLCFNQDNGPLPLVTDYRRLDKYIKRIIYYMPIIRERIMRLSNDNCILTFYTNMGYDSSRISLYRRRVMISVSHQNFLKTSTSIATALEEYQACREQIYYDLKFKLEDFLVLFESPEDWMIVFEGLTHYDVTLNEKKSHLSRQQKLSRIYLFRKTY